MTMPPLPPLGNPPGFEEPHQQTAPEPTSSPAAADARHHTVRPATSLPWPADAPVETSSRLPNPWAVAPQSTSASGRPAPEQPAAAAHPAEPAANSEPKPKRRGVGLPALIGIGVAALVVGAGASLGITALTQPSALASIPEKCNLAEGSYELSDTELTLHAPEAVPDADRFNGDAMCVLYTLDVEPEGQTFVDYLETLEEPAELGGYAVSVDPESADLKVVQS